MIPLRHPISRLAVSAVALLIRMDWQALWPDLHELESRTMTICTYTGALMGQRLAGDGGFASPAHGPSVSDA